MNHGVELNLNPSVERAQVRPWQSLWVGATTQRTSVRKAKQHPHGDCQGCNWVRSDS